MRKVSCARGNIAIFRDHFLGLTCRKDRLSGLYAFLKMSCLCLRYSAVRKQFGPPGEGEIPVLEYQMQVCEAGILSSSLHALQT